MGSLTKRKIDAAKSVAGKNVRLWDDDPRGFGVYVKPSAVKAFFIQYRSPVTDKKRRYTIGQYGWLTLDEARKEARKLLVQVAKGEDPLETRVRARQEAGANAQTIAELCDEYMADATAGKITYRGKPKKTSTLEIDAGRIKRHIKPLLGHKLIRDITQNDVISFMHDVRLGRKIAIKEKTGPRGVARVTGGTATAKRTTDLLGSIFSYAVRRRIRPDNPVSGVERSPTRKRDRILTPDEYARLGEALAELENRGANTVAIRAYRVLALTGCRRNEIFSLKKPEVDAHIQCLRFGDTKTGQQVRAIGREACDFLTLPHFNDESEFVFPASHGDGHLIDAKLFRQVCAAANLEEVSLHTLRHTFASVALELEYSEMTVAALLGHRLHSITSRYAHHVDRALVGAADRVSSLITARMEGRKQGGTNVIRLNLPKV